jgi:hypothetical protein
LETSQASASGHTPTDGTDKTCSTCSLLSGTFFLLAASRFLPLSKPVRLWRTILIACALLWGSVDALALRCVAPEVTPENRCTPVFDNGVSRARYYSPQLGRFWTMDTFGGFQRDPLSLHKYTFCANNPVNAVDPSGHLLEGVMLDLGIRMWGYAAYAAPVIKVGTVAGGIILGAMIVTDQQFREEFFAAWISSGGNPVGELQLVMGEIRTFATAMTASRLVNSVGGVKAFTAAEEAIITEARQIYMSTEFAQIKAAKEAGRTIRVVVNGRTIQYQPGLPFSGMTWQEQNGFIISDEAFKSEDELAKTLAHELHRLNTSNALAQGAINGEAAAKETRAAYLFAEKAGEQIK